MFTSLETRRQIGDFLQTYKMKKRFRKSRTGYEKYVRVPIEDIIVKQQEKIKGIH